MIRASTKWNSRLWWSEEPILFRKEHFLRTVAVVLLATLAAAKDVRPNVVAEVPSLDIGPVVVVRVIKGSAARLPCRHPHHPEDTLNLVLWYLDHSTRPFLSYDARSLAKEKYYRNTNKLTDFSKIANAKNKTRKASRRRKSADDCTGRRSIRSSGANLKTGSSRKSLSSGGTTLIIQNVKATDEAEYRCRVHFRQSPTWTQRLKLIVAEDVETVVLEDSTGLSVNTRVGPLEEGSNLSLTCQASHDVESLWWLLEGKPLDTSWASAGEDVVVNRLVVTVVQENFSNACVTCRLTTTNEGDPYIAANITERSITIAMFYVPVAVLRSDGGQRYLGGGVELAEGQTLSFLCSVRADPPVYSLIWLHNGQKRNVGGRFLARDNTSLVISPVTRKDSGIYACLASNSEGDGHSNAIPVVVKHMPYCAGPPHQELVVTANTSISLTCQVDAQPKDVSFTWKIGVQSPTHRHSQSTRGHQVNHILSSALGEPPKDIREDDPSDIFSRRFAEFPFFSKDFRTHLGVSNSIGLTSYSETRDGAKWTKSTDGSYGTGEWKTLDHQIDPRNPGRSTVTLTPSMSTVVSCYARNSIGHAKVPCTYTLTVVEPPKPLQDCNVTVIGITRMEVRCDDPSYSQDPVGDASPLLGGEGHHSPSMSFVRSPRSSTKANLEVWSGDTLVANVSEGRPIFNVRGLPPDAHLRLVLYTVSPHSHSTPLYMVAKTQPQRHVHLSAAPPAPQSPMQHPITKPAMEIGTNLFDGFNWRLGGIMGGVAVMAVALVVGVVMWVWEKFGSWHYDHAQGNPHQLQHYPGITLDTLASEDSLNEETGVIRGEVPPV
ncbi:protein sidekick-1-like isoform X2 [Palaemon carinicauda]|uniref:protein sidekick-1-like isoform X2 n=1 Tax=Palaemon carinicauda TaxID=392227 RepID=UPI0035B69F63